MEYSPKLAALLLLALASAIVVTAQNTKQDVVDAHNAARADVGVGPVSWDATVEAWAKLHVKKFRADCNLQHSRDGPYGENIFLSSSGANWTAVEMVNSWVSGKQYYDHDSNTCSAQADGSCGTYIQVVWSNTTVIGCARTVCDGDGGSFGICGYNPPGNVKGQAPY